MREELPLLRSDAAAFVDDFTGPALDRERWVDHYLPHWTTPDRSRARSVFTPDGLQLRIEADQLDWRVEDAPLRVSNLQTATSPGTHRHRPDGLTVRTPTPTRVLWAPRAGHVDVRITPSLDPGCMTAVWLVGVEDQSPDDSGEICLCEVDADAVGASTTRARTGVKAHHDPRLATDITEVDVGVVAGAAATWSARWDADGVIIACDGTVVHTSTQQLSYPLQLMVGLFEVGPRGAPNAYPKVAAVHRVRGS